MQAYEIQQITPSACLCREAIMDPGARRVCTLAYQMDFRCFYRQEENVILFGGLRCAIRSAKAHLYRPARTGKTKPLADLGMGPWPPLAMVTAHAKGALPPPGPVKIDDDQ